MYRAIDQSLDKLDIPLHCVKQKPWNYQRGAGTILYAPRQHIAPKPDVGTKMIVIEPLVSIEVAR